MTDPNFTVTDTLPRVQYTATNLQTEFVIPFRFLDGADIKVLLGTNTAPESPSSYVVVGDGLTSNGTLTFIVGIANNTLVTIYRDSTFERITNFSDSGDWTAQNINDQLNDLTLFVQEIALKANDLSVTLPLSTLLSTLMFPDSGAALNADKVITWDPAGTALVNGPSTTGITNAATDAAAAADSAALAAVNAATLWGTSVSSVSLGIGPKVFTTETGKQFDAGTWLLVTSDAGPINYFHGQVTTYSGTTLTLNVTNFGGTGTFNDWTIDVSGTQGATGATGATGAGSGDLLAAQNLSDVDNAATSLANLGGVGAATSDTLTNKTIDANGTGNIVTNLDIGNSIAASQAEAEAGSDNTKLVTSLRVAQAIAALGSSISQANQAAIEAETNENTYIPPDLLKHHPGVLNATCVIQYSSGTPSILVNHNITGITDSGTGDLRVTFSMSFSSTNYNTQVTLRRSQAPLDNTTTNAAFPIIENHGAVTFTDIKFYTTDIAAKTYQLADPNGTIANKGYIHVSVSGDL